MVVCLVQSDTTKQKLISVQEVYCNIGCQKECAICNEIYECEVCNVEYMLVQGECLTCVPSICMPMNYFITFHPSAQNATVSFDFPVADLDKASKLVKAQIYTFTQTIYTLNISSIQYNNETAFSLSFNMTTSVFSNDTLILYLDDSLYNKRQGVYFSNTQLIVNPPYTFVCCNIIISD